MNKDYKTAFSILVKMKSPKIFEFLRKVQLDIDLKKYLGKLLKIDSSSTVDYILQRFGRYELFILSCL